MSFAVIQTRDNLIASAVNCKNAFKAKKLLSSMTKDQFHAGSLFKV